MERISLNGKVMGYAEQPKDVVNFVPEGSPTGIKMLGGTDRELTYGDDKYIISQTDKTKGIDVGDICPLCEKGEIMDLGGCDTCSVCGFQTHCGL